LLDLIASFLVKALNAFFNVMPISFNLWVGRGVGRIFYAFSGKRGRITYANLKAAFYKDKKPKELKRLTKQAYCNAAQTFAEILSLTKVNKAYIEKYVKIHNIERVHEVANNPNGMMLLSAHYGNWELSIAASAIVGYPLYVLARDQKMEKLNELINRLRELKGSMVIRKGMDIKNVFRILREGKNIGILADQNAGPSGILLDLFGRPASTAVGPFRIAQKTGAIILPAFMKRRKGPYHDLFVEPAMYIKKGEDIEIYMKRYNSFLEKYISDRPELWFWMHKRWKLTPLKKILILDDGKKGHLKQSLSIAKQIEKHRIKDGYVPEKLETDIVKIFFKHKFSKTILNLMNPFFTKRAQGRLKCLKWALTKESYDNVVMRYADVVVSCGSSLYAVNQLLSIENNARNVAILDPGKISRNKYDLVVIPRHDMKNRKFDQERIIVTELAPNLIDPEKLFEFRREDQKNCDRRCVGLLFGGDNEYFTFSDDLAQVVADEIVTGCREIESCFYGTTSRRTSRSVLGILEKTFSELKGCSEFIDGAKDNDKFTVEKILANSTIIIVSGESVSMVSEAVASGKPVLVFMPEKNKMKHTKYEKFILNLEQKKYIKVVNPGEISKEMKKIVFQKEPVDRKIGSVADGDNEKIFSKMYKLF